MEYVSGNILLREMIFENAGDSIIGHEHTFDHTTYIPHGALRVELLDAEGDAVKSVVKRASERHNWVLIKAGVRHRITAVEDGSIGHCVYAHRVPQALVDHKGKDPEYDALLDKLMAMADERFGQIVQVYDGWEKAYA
jgi:hypothetical protein